MAMPEAMAGPVMGTMPPTQQMRPIEDILEEAHAAIWARDGVMDEREMNAVRTFFEAQQTNIQAMQQGQQPNPTLGLAQTPEQVQQPQQPPEGAGQTEDFMAGSGEPLEQGDPQDQQDDGTEDYEQGGY